MKVLPVADDGELGILSLNNVVLAACDNTPVRDRDVVDALQRICVHHHGNFDQAAA